MGRLAIGDIISFARSCYGHHVPELFVKAAAVALLLSPGLDWTDNDTIPNYRQQLKELMVAIVVLHQKHKDDHVSLS